MATNNHKKKHKKRSRIYIYTYMFLCTCMNIPQRITVSHATSRLYKPTISHSSAKMLLTLLELIKDFKRWMASSSSSPLEIDDYVCSFRFGKLSHNESGVPEWCSKSLNVNVHSFLVLWWDSGASTLSVPCPRTQGSFTPMLRSWSSPFPLTFLKLIQYNQCNSLYFLDFCI